MKEAYEMTPEMLARSKDENGKPYGICPITGRPVDKHGYTITPVRPPIKTNVPRPDFAGNMVRAVKAHAADRIARGGR